MKNLHFVYNDQTIDFTANTDENILVNATQMAKIFDKRVQSFLRSDHANDFISVMELTPFGVSSKVLKRSEIVKTINGNATWMHRILALKFAAWLDPKFELWVYTTIDKIILGHYKEHKEATIEKLQAQEDLKNKKIELTEKYPEFVEFLKIEEQIKDAARKQGKTMKESVQQLHFELFPEEIHLKK